MESDWKKFRAMVPALRERYLARENRTILAILTDAGRNDTERFWDAMEKMKKEAKILQRCLDGHSRSSMWQYVALMIHAGLMTKEDTAQFSAELQSRLAHVLEQK